MTFCDTLTETISLLETWSLYFSHNKHHNPIAALQVNKPTQKDQNQLICVNPNCRHWGHTIEVCYWPGSGKEGQFPPGFGKREDFKHSTANTHQDSFRTPTRANFVSANNMPKEEELVFAFMASNTHDLKVLATPIPTNKSLHVISYRSNKTIEKEDDRGGVPLNKFWSGEDPIIFHT